MALRRGTITVRSCMMIEAVIYGPTPSMTMERFDNPPPENRFKRFKNSLPEKRLASLEVSIPGTGISAKRRVIARINNTKNILFRRDLSAKANLSFSKTLCIIIYSEFIELFALFSYLLICQMLFQSLTFKRLLK